MTPWVVLASRAPLARRGVTVSQCETRRVGNLLERKGVDVGGRVQIFQAP